MNVWRAKPLRKSAILSLVRQHTLSPLLHRTDRLVPSHRSADGSHQRNQTDTRGPVQQHEPISADADERDVAKAAYSSRSGGPGGLICRWGHRQEHGRDKLCGHEENPR